MLVVCEEVCLEWACCWDGGCWKWSGDRGCCLVLVTEVWVRREIGWG